MAALLNVIYILLVLLTPLSYLPFYKGLFVLRSVNGISVTAALLLALCAQAQLATIYYLWACPPSKKYGLVIPKPPLLVEYINLVQLFVQWICSVLLLVFIFEIRKQAQADLTTPAPTTPSTETSETPATAAANDSTFPSTKTAVTLLAVHASLCVFWILLAGHPTDDWADLPFVTIMGIGSYVINPIITITTIAAFALQAIATKNTQGPSALNQSVLLLQGLTFLALAISWAFRFKVPLNLRIGFRGDWWLLEEWYPIVGWTCINNAVIAIGNGIVLSLLYFASRRTESVVEPEGEQQPLLNP